MKRLNTALFKKVRLFLSRDLKRKSADMSLGRAGHERPSRKIDKILKLRDTSIGQERLYALIDMQTLMKNTRGREACNRLKAQSGEF